MTDWVKCPICGESDMEKEPDDDGFIINCTNLACASNGGDNDSEILKKYKEAFNLWQKLTR